MLMAAQMPLSSNIRWRSDGAKAEVAKQSKIRSLILSVEFLKIKGISFWGWVWHGVGFGN
jgi:hypothetical protein